jgi:hypothetical protein
MYRPATSRCANLQYAALLYATPRYSTLLYRVDHKVVALGANKKINLKKGTHTCKFRWDDAALLYATPRYSTLRRATLRYAALL